MDYFAPDFLLEAVQTIGTIAAIGLSLWAIIDARHQRYEAAKPSIKADWAAHEQGHSCTVTIVNRIDEYLTIESIRGKSPISRRVLPDKPWELMEQPRFSEWSNTIKLHWEVAPNQTDSEIIYINGTDSPRWLQIMLTSTNSALRKKSFILRPPS
ncbi:MAG: hypothetical protein V2I27_13720 [Erythrobacter sp.]|jgi:hypothetical protein|nr:hypothetical protein [Erythrobacter sp.]